MHDKMQRERVIFGLLSLNLSMDSRDLRGNNTIHLVASETFHKVLCEMYKIYEQSFFEFIELGQYAKNQHQNFQNLSAHDEDSHGNNRHMYGIHEIVSLKRYIHKSTVFKLAEKVYYLLANAS